MNFFGIPAGPSISNNAPEAVRFLTLQEIAPPPKEIVPALKTLVRGCDRLSSMIDPEEVCLGDFIFSGLAPLLADRKPQTESPPKPPLASELVQER